MPDMTSDEVFAMLCREHDRTTGGDKVLPGQDWRDPDGVTWHVGATVTHGGERTALMTGPYGEVLHLPASLVARQYHRIDAERSAPRPRADGIDPERGRDDAP